MQSCAADRVEHDTAKLNSFVEYHCTSGCVFWCFTVCRSNIFIISVCDQFLIHAVCLMTCPYSLQVQVDSEESDLDAWASDEELYPEPDRKPVHVHFATPTRINTTNNRADSARLTEQAGTTQNIGDRGRRLRAERPPHPR